MISFQEAQKIVLNSLHTLPSQTIHVQESVGRVLAEDIYSKVNLPEFDNSAMDGYAVRSSDCSGPSPAMRKHSKLPILKIVGEIKPSDVTKRFHYLKPTEAMKVFTGSPIPSGADAVVPKEDTEKVKSEELRVKSEKQQYDFIKVITAVKKGQHIRLKGENVCKGELVIPKGKVIRSEELGMLLQLNYKKVKVTKKPTVAIISTGDELIEPTEKLSKGKIVNTNSYMLSSEVISSGGIPVNLGIAKDNKREIKIKIKKGLKLSDILIVSAGVSVSEHDYVKEAFREVGVKQKFWQVAQRPGKPLYFGVYRRNSRHLVPHHNKRRKTVLVFGLPGNPVSGLVCFKLYVKPAIFKMLGIKNYLPKLIYATATEEIKVKPNRTYFLRGIAEVQNGKYFVRLSGPQGTGILKSMVSANCLIVLPEDKFSVFPDEKVLIKL
ncbi:MAG: molybdopterin molybdotransferase MoeA [Elusimicrobiota bacterium]|nr:molybdopterin molybdotransferase MoeA [Elusimicrobiota bacterium]